MVEVHHDNDRLLPINQSSAWRASLQVVVTVNAWDTVSYIPLWFSDRALQRRIT